MSHRRHHPSNNDHDPSSNTDISIEEIDAFDALIEGISQGNRYPDSWSGARQQRPNDRIDRSDALTTAETLARSASSFQRHVDAAHDSRYGAQSPDPHLWETIMQANTTPAPGMLTMGQSWSGPVTSASRGDIAGTRAKPSTPRWATSVNLAIVAVILLAGFGVWANRPGNDGNGIAWQPETPINQLAALGSPDASAEATPGGTAECPLPPANEGDVDEFTDYEGVITDIENCVGMFEWPTGFQPDIEKIRAHYQGFTGRVQRGAGVESLIGFNDCAWSITWLEARATGNAALEEHALGILSQETPDYVDSSTREMHERRTEAMQNDDSSEVEQFVGANCYPLWWTSYEGIPPAGEQVPPTVATVATPAPTSECDLGGDIPIFSHTTEVAFDGTSLRLNDDGQLVLGCAADPEGAVVASDVLSVSPFDWPGMVTLTLDAIQVDKLRFAVLDLATGKMVEVGHRAGSMRNDLYHQPESPWLVAPALENPQDWGITDLRTMETRLLSEYTGGSLPFDVSVLTSSNGSTGSIAIAVADPENQARYTVVPNDDELPGSVLILENSFDAAHWIPVPEQVVGLTDPQLSPDGSSLAFETGYSDDDPGADSTFLIVQTSDGAAVAESALSDDPDPNALWANDSSGLIYTNGAALGLLSTTPGREPEVLFEQPAPGTLGNLKATYDPDVFLVDRIGTEDFDVEFAAGIEQHVYSVNIVTGEVITFDGWDASDNLRPWVQDTRFLVMYEPALLEAEVMTYQVYDTVTGEPVGEPVEAPNVLAGSAGLGKSGVTSTQDGSSEVIGFDSRTIYLMRTVDGVSTVTRVTPPVDSLVPVGLELSADGSYLAARVETDGASIYWLLDLESDDATWIEIPDDGDSTSYYVRFVQGIDD